MIAGIVVGLLVLIAAILIFLILLLKRRSKREQEDDEALENQRKIRDRVTCMKPVVFQANAQVSLSEFSYEEEYEEIEDKDEYEEDIVDK